MAATLTPDGELTYFSFPIEKTEETADGDLIVYGKATDGTVDSDLQIVDQEWSAKAIHEWLNTGGNLRVQHQARRDPAGKGLAVEATPDGHFVKALVVEPVAKDLVRKGVLTCYSVGITHPDIVPDPSGKAANGIIRGRRDGLTKISEISLVDRGSNFNSQFQLVKAAGDGAPEFVGKMMGETVTIENAVTGSTLNEDELRRIIDDQVSRSLGVTPADVAKALTGHDGVAKRKVDPNVGGGVDRDKIPAEDFAGNDRSFPIVTPQDVHDAASSIGRAGGDNKSPEGLKSSIIRIARRKGAAFTARLPESWKKELGMSDSAKTTDTEPTTDATDVEEKTVDVDAAEDEAAKTEEPEAAKADDGAASESDDEDDKCDDGMKAVEPTVEKVVTVEKKDKVICRGCGANIHAQHNFCPECGGKLNDALAIKKNHDFTCLGCGYQLDKGEKFCPSCGKAHPGYLPEADSKVKAAGDDGSADKAAPPAAVEGESDEDVKANKKALKKAARRAEKKATPTDAADEAADADPVPAHREPDGPAIEALEHDAGLPTVDDDSVKAADLILPGDPEGSAAMRLKMLNVPTDYGVLHDLTCPAYHPDDVAKSYPRVDLTSLDADHWQRRAFEMAASAPLDQARKANELWQHVVVLKGTDEISLLQARSDLYKSFRDANPGPGSFPTPGSLNARSFNRPLVSAGHEAPSPGHDGPNTAPNPFGSISAAQFDRGFLAGGHAAESPSDQQGMMQPVSAPTVTGVPTRTYYTNAMRNNARQAMLAMHDHIAQTFPDLCPTYTGPSPYPSGALPGARPVPVGVGGPVPHGATKAKKAKKAKELSAVSDEATIDAVEKTAEPTVEKAVTLDLATVQAMITKAVADVNEARDAEVADLKKVLRKTRKRLEAIAEQPDPNGPYRGLALDQIAKSSAAPEVLPSVSRAERAQENLFRVLHHQWRNDPDPMQREVAWRELSKMSGINSINK